MDNNDDDNNNVSTLFFFPWLKIIFILPQDESVNWFRDLVDGSRFFCKIMRTCFKGWKDELKIKKIIFIIIMVRRKMYFFLNIIISWANPPSQGKQLSSLKPGRRRKS